METVKDACEMYQILAFKDLEKSKSTEIRENAFKTL